MRAKSKSNTKQKGMSKPFSWLAFISLFAFFVGIFASAQETSRKLSFSGDVVRTSLQSTARHSEHCIRHQNPLPEYENAPAASSLGSDFSTALQVVTTVALEGLQRKPSREFSYTNAKAHVGVSVYKYFAHFLI